MAKDSPKVARQRRRTVKAFEEWLEAEVQAAERQLATQDSSRVQLLQKISTLREVQLRLIVPAGMATEDGGKATDLSVVTKAS